MLQEKETPNNYSVKKLDLIDTIQHLGVAYHFESEIEAVLHNIYDSYPEFIPKDHEDANNFRVVALQFGLFRQPGYSISSGE